MSQAMEQSELLTTKQVGRHLKRQTFHVEMLTMLAGIDRRQIAQCKLYDAADMERLREAFAVYEAASGFDTEAQEQLRDLWDDFARQVLALRNQASDR